MICRDGLLVLAGSVFVVIHRPLGHARFRTNRIEQGFVLVNVLEHYEKQSDVEAVAEDEAAYESTTHTATDIPVELVPQVRQLLAKRRAG